MAIANKVVRDNDIDLHEGYHKIVHVEFQIPTKENDKLKAFYDVGVWMSGKARKEDKCNPIDSLRKRYEIKNPEILKEMLQLLYTDLSKEYNIENKEI